MPQCFFVSNHFYSENLRNTAICRKRVATQAWRAAALLCFQAAVTFEVGEVASSDPNTIFVKKYAWIDVLHKKSTPNFVQYSVLRNLWIICYT